MAVLSKGHKHVQFHVTNMALAQPLFYFREMGTCYVVFKGKNPGISHGGREKDLGGAAINIRVCIPNNHVFYAVSTYEFFLS